MCLKNITIYSTTPPFVHTQHTLCVNICVNDKGLVYDMYMRAWQVTMMLYVLYLNIYALCGGPLADMG